MENKKRIILAITGASGAIYGLRALEALKTLGHEVHLVLSAHASAIIAQEVPTHSQRRLDLADHRHRAEDLHAPIASGSFPTDGMLVVPCSIKSLSGIAHSYAENLIQRAADVTLKEGRPLLLAVRETPLHVGHLHLMTRAAEAGAIIFPPVPAFYHPPESVDDLVRASVGRMLSRIGIQNELFKPWGD